MMTPFDLLILVLATCYWAMALTKTHGVFGIFALAREKLPHGGLLTCPICLAFWLALGFYALLQTPLAPVVTVSALAGGATVVGFYTGAWQQ